jgi:ComF family protein
MPGPASTAHSRCSGWQRKTLLEIELIPSYPEPGRVERCLDLVFPPMCVGCRKVGRWICPQCWGQLEWARKICGICATPSFESPCRGCMPGASAVRTVVAVAAFQGVAREAVHALKYEGRHAISTTMGKLMAREARELEVDLVVPTPLHAARRRERGYDQAALLARPVARELGARFDGAALKRTRRTRQQVSLGPEERRENVAGAFTATCVLHGERVLLVDDVYTTGATIEAAAHALVEGGATSVVGAVFGYASAGGDASGRRPNPRPTWWRRGRSTR